MYKSSEHTAMALNLDVSVSNEGRVMPETLVQLGAKLRNLQLLQFGYRFYRHPAFHKSCYSLKKGLAMCIVVSTNTLDYYGSNREKKHCSSVFAQV